MAVTLAFLGADPIVEITFSGGAPTPSAQDPNNYTWNATVLEGFPPNWVFAPTQPTATYIGTVGNTVSFSLYNIVNGYYYWANPDPATIILPEGGFWASMTPLHGDPIGYYTGSSNPAVQPEPEPEDSTFTETALDIESFTTFSDVYTPLTGAYSTEEDIEGWVWDKRLLEDLDEDSTRYLNTIGGHTVGLKDGTKSTFWQSGSILGTKFLDISRLRLFGETLSWTPRVESGKFSILFQPKNLYSDYSYTSKFNATDPSSNIELRDDCRYDTISAILYHRDDNFINWPWDVYSYVEAFTGEFPEGGERLEVEDSEGNILWASLSTRRREFIIGSDGFLFLNQDATRTIGTQDTPTLDNIDVFEYKGRGNSSGRDCYSDYFPIKEGTSRVLILSGETIRELASVDSLNFSTEDDDVFAADEDLGIISLGGYRAPDLVLKESLDVYDDEVVCYLDDRSIASYPQQGVIEIGDESILYYGKGRNTFFDCVRGYNSTIAAQHNVGTVVSDIQHGKATKKSDKVYIAYEAVPRIEYEVLTEDVRTSNKAPFVSVKAVHNTKTNNILQISPVEKHVTDLVLEVDKPLIGSNTYGPIYYGSDFARLIARANDSLGLPVEGIDITIELLSNGTGTVNGGAKYTSLSNTLGEIYALYNAPYSWDSISKKILDITHELGGTVFDIEKLPLGLTAEDITIYQVLKHDRTYGTVGQRLDILGFIEHPEIAGNTSNSPAIWVSAVFEDAPSQWESNKDNLDPKHVVDQKCGSNSSYGSAFVDIKFVNLAGDARWVRRKIREAIDYYVDVGGIQTRAGTLFLLENNIPKDANEDATLCYAVEKGAAVWTGDLQNGLPVVLYEWDDTVRHPLNDTLGAYYPLRPDSMSQEQLLFAGRELPLPEPFDIESNLGGYLIVTSDVVTLRASCTDPVSGRVIVSNKVKIRLDIPPYLNGVDSSQALPIPYGFGFLTEDHNVGTGLGGANFLTINPKAEGVNAFSLNINIG